MKVRLLKKLRKRFIWFYDPTYFNEWRVFDKQTEREVIGLPDAGYFYIERAILKMLQITGDYHLWQSRRTKFENMRKVKRDIETKQLFYSKIV